VVAATGPLIYEMPAGELIEKGMLAKPIIKFLPVNQLYFDQYVKYIDVYREGIVRNELRNLRIVKLIKEQTLKRRKVLVFVDFIEHGEILQGMLELQKVMQADDHPFLESQFVHGEDKERDWKFSAFKHDEGMLNVLIATEGLIGEGYDYKGIDVVVIADGGKSAIQTIQKIGRGMRVMKDKKEVYIFDFADRCKYLQEHAKERINIWYSAGHDIEAPKYMENLT
jgi:superfamily II DNA or RNA helicase